MKRTGILNLAACLVSISILCSCGSPVTPPGNTSTDTAAVQDMYPPMEYKSDDFTLTLPSSFSRFTEEETPDTNSFSDLSEDKKGEVAMQAVWCNKKVYESKRGIDDIIEVVKLSRPTTPLLESGGTNLVDEAWLQHGRDGNLGTSREVTLSTPGKHDGFPSLESEIKPKEPGKYGKQLVVIGPQQLVRMTYWSTSPETLKSDEVRKIFESAKFPMSGPDVTMNNELVPQKGDFFSVKLYDTMGPFTKSESTVASAAGPIKVTKYVAKNKKVGSPFTVCRYEYPEGTTVVEPAADYVHKLVEAEMKKLPGSKPLRVIDFKYNDKYPAADVLFGTKTALQRMVLVANQPKAVYTASFVGTTGRDTLFQDVDDQMNSLKFEIAK